MKLKYKNLTDNMHSKSKSFFPQPKKEDWGSWFARWKINRFPAFKRTGGKVTYVHPEFMEVHMKLPLNKNTVNYNGTLFGGSIYSAVEWIPPIMYMQCLGPQYIAWNKESRIQFIKPGSETLYSKYTVSTNDLTRIRTKLIYDDKIEISCKMNLMDQYKTIYAMVNLLIQVRNRNE